LRSERRARHLCGRRTFWKCDAARFPPDCCSGGAPGILGPSERLSLGVAAAAIYAIQGAGQGPNSRESRAKCENEVASGRNESCWPLCLPSQALDAKEARGREGSPGTRWSRAELSARRNVCSASDPAFRQASERGPGRISAIHSGCCACRTMKPHKHACFCTGLRYGVRKQQPE
jgi:hypothetical protein